ncbi:MAG: efflux RND transporter permease subunit [Myxococcales bacterium]|nr:efflux RND transporter permease subunit [Myxococcales bacterium]
MTAADWAARHRRSILFLLAVLALGGFLSATTLPVALFPKVAFPRIQVVLDAGNRPAEQMLSEVMRPVEEAIRTVPGLRSIRSNTSRGSAELSVSFDWGSDMPQALLNVDAAITQSLSQLPPGVQFEAKRMDATVYPVAAYVLTSDRHDLVGLHEIARYELVPLLSSIDGVANVTVLGGSEREYRVDVDPNKLRAYGLSLDDVVRALSASNVLEAVGQLQDHYKLYLMLSDTRFRSLGQIETTVLSTGGNGLVSLEDVATVRPAAAPSWIRVTGNGHRAVSLQIYQQPGGNTVRIVQDIKAKLAGYKARLPAGVHISNWYDQSTLITASAKSVRDAILIGVALAGLVLVLFLGSVRVALVALFVVPVVLAITMLLLSVLHMTLNIMTFGGMAAAVGLIIDDAIVMIENIVRRARQWSDRPLHARIRDAARELFQPLVGSSASTVVVFVPLAFLSGVTGAFFKALSITMASALVISFLVAWLAVPLLADHLLTAGQADKEDTGPVTGRVNALYRRVMAKTLARPAWLLVGVVPLVLGGALAYARVGSGFLPAMDEGGFVLDYVAPAGTSLDETNRLLLEVEAILEKNPYVASYSRRTGAQLGGGITEANTGDFFIRLKDGPRPPIDDVMQRIREAVHARVPVLDVETAQLMEDLIGDLTAVPQPIEIKLFGDDSDQLMQLAPRVANAISSIDGVVSVLDGIVVAGDALEVQVDRRKAALEGVDPQQVTEQLNAYFSGVVTSHIQEGVRVIGIRVWVPRHLRQTVDQVGAMLVRAPDGHRFRLARVATVKLVTGQPEITGENLKQMVAVTARVEGRDLGSTIRDVKQALARDGLIPKQVTYELGGLYEQQQIAFRGLLEVFGAAVALVFVLLLYLYERFRAAIAILLMPLTAIAGVFIGLWLTGIELNITALMGITMIVGIVTEVAIFYFSEYHLLLDEGTPPREALIEAGVNRLRPIVMTSLAFMLALLPLALDLGSGAAMQQPLAVAIISGLLAQVPLVLIVMPVVFALLHGGATRLPPSESA